MKKRSGKFPIPIGVELDEKILWHIGAPNIKMSNTINIVFFAIVLKRVNSKRANLLFIQLKKILEHSKKLKSNISPIILIRYGVIQKYVMPLGGRKGYTYCDKLGQLFRWEGGLLEILTSRSK